MFLRTLDVNDLHLTGVAAMFLATKYEEVYPLRMSIVFEKIGHKKLPCESIRQRERDILSSVNYEMTSVTLYEFIDNLITFTGIKDFTPTVLGDQFAGYLQRVSVYLAKMVLHDYDLISSYTYATLAAGTLFVTFKIIEQLDRSFSASQQIQHVVDAINMSNDLVIFDAATKILNLAKSFETKYANLENLKRFHEVSFEDINKGVKDVVN